MKNLVIFALVSMGSMTLAPGCIIVADDDDPGDPGDPGGDDLGIEVSWDLLGVGDTPDGCAAAGVATIEAVSDPDAGIEGDEFRDFFNCEDLVHVTQALPAGQYDVYINAWSGEVNQSTLVAQSGFVEAVPGDSVDFSNVYYNAGFFSLTWTLVDSANAEVSCADAGAVDVAVDLTTQPEGDLIPSAGLFPCADGSGITEPVFLHDYSIAVDALASDGTPLQAAAVVKEDLLDTGNELNDLGDFVLPIE